MSKGGGSTNTVTQQSAPNPTAQGAYNTAVNTGTNVAQQPYTPYNGSLVAGFNPTQNAAFQNINNASGLGQPYIEQAANLIHASTSGVDPASTVGSYTNPNLSSQFLDPARGLAATSGQGINPLGGQFGVQNFMNPYTQDVVHSLQDTQQERDAAQQTQLAGSAASAGAFGGDRAQIAQSVLAREQGLADNSAISSALQSGYGQALGAAMQTGTTNAQLGLGAGQLYGSLGGLNQGAYNTALQTGLGSQEANAWLASQGAFGLGNLGQEAQSLGLSGANAQLQAGGLQQQLAQEQLNVPYQQFQQAQAYPFQTTNFQLGLATGSPGGGSSSTTSPGPSTVSQLTGLGLTGLGLANSGAFSGIGNWFGGAGAATGSVAPAASDTGWFDTSGLGAGGTDTGWFTPPPVARGGRIGYDDGGAVMAPLGLGANMPTGGLPATTEAGLGSGNPMVTQQMQQLNGLPTEKLREMQARMPPGSPQGNVVSMVLRRRMMMPQSNPAMAGLGTVPTVPGMAAGGSVPLAWEPQGDREMTADDWAAMAAAPTQSGFDIPAETRGLVDPTATGLAAHDPTARNEGGLGALPPMVRPSTPPSRAVHPAHGLGAGIPIPPEFVPPPDREAAAPDARVETHGGLGAEPSFLDRITSGGNGALIAAGLGIMGGESPFALTNIGRGALSGLSWAEQQKARQAQQQYNFLKEQDLADYHRSMAQNAANRTDAYSRRVNDLASLGQMKASQAMALAAMRMGAHATAGDIEAQTISELMHTPKPGTDQPYTRAEAFKEMHGLNIRQQNADTATGRLSLSEQTAALTAEDKAFTHQQRANAMDVQAARSIMAAAAMSGKVVPYRQALGEAMSGNRALPEPPAAAPRSPPSSGDSSARPALDQLLPP